jgi:hypothetical protein
VPLARLHLTSWETQAEPSAEHFVRLHQVNENQAGEVAAILGYLRAVQRMHAVGVIVVHHARKNGGSTGG